jgi:hypothetical protein
MNTRLTLPRPDRLRTIEKPFAWLPFRLLTDGIFADLSDRAKLLYIFLCLAADRQGSSFYGDAKIQTYFQLGPEEIDLARTELIHKDLLAYDGRLYQVLSIPSADCRPPRRTKPLPEHRAGEPERFADILKRLAKETS